MFDWSDQYWMEQRSGRNNRAAPISIYEVHLASWRRKPEENNGYLTYRDLADQLVPYVADLGFTHIEVLPVSEYPFDGSWGYQPVGLFAPTCRFGTPDDFRYFVDRCHQAGIALWIDWVPGHFPSDPHGLALFDGTHLYDHADPRQGFSHGMEYADLQLRPARGLKLLDLQCVELAGAIPRRWVAGRCRGVDAVFGLQP